MNGLRELWTHLVTELTPTVYEIGDIVYWRDEQMAKNNTTRSRFGLGGASVYDGFYMPDHLYLARVTKKIDEKKYFIDICVPTKIIPPGIPSDEEAEIVSLDAQHQRFHEAQRFYETITSTSLMPKNRGDIFITNILKNPYTKMRGWQEKEYVDTFKETGDFVQAYKAASHFVQDDVACWHIGEKRVIPGVVSGHIMNLIFGSDYYKFTYKDKDGADITQPVGRAHLFSKDLCDGKIEIPPEQIKSQPGRTVPMFLGEIPARKPTTAVVLEGGVKNVLDAHFAQGGSAHTLETHDMLKWAESLPEEALPLHAEFIKAGVQDHLGHTKQVLDTIDSESANVRKRYLNLYRKLTTTAKLDHAKAVQELKQIRELWGEEQINKTHLNKLAAERTEEKRREMMLEFKTTREAEARAAKEAARVAAAAREKEAQNLREKARLEQEKKNEALRVSAAAAAGGIPVAAVGAASTPASPAAAAASPATAAASPAAVQATRAAIEARAYAGEIDAQRFARSDEEPLETALMVGGAVTGVASFLMVAIQVLR